MVLILIVCRELMGTGLGGGWLGIDCDMEDGSWEKVERGSARILHWFFWISLNLSSSFSINYWVQIKHFCLSLDNLKSSVL